MPRRRGSVEAVVTRGVRESDAAAVLAGMRGLGYLPDAVTEWDGELLLEYMREVSWWLDGDEPLRLAPEDLWRGAEVLRERDAGNLIAQLKRMTVPPEALLLRRMEGLLFQTAAMLRAGARWGPLLRELIEGADPVGELGAEHAAWHSAHRLSER